MRISGDPDEVVGSLAHVKPVRRNLFSPMVHLFEKNLLTGHFATLIPREQLVETVTHRSVDVLLRINGTLCGPLEIPGGPPVAHLDHVENHLT